MYFAYPFFISIIFLTFSIEVTVGIAFEFAIYYADKLIINI
jgi:xanthine/uracil/vitamin C permease (AzgA family)